MTVPPSKQIDSPVNQAVTSYLSTGPTLALNQLLSDPKATLESLEVSIEEKVLVFVEWLDSAAFGSLYQYQTGIKRVQLDLYLSFPEFVNRLSIDAELARLMVSVARSGNGESAIKSLDDGTHPDPFGMLRRLVQVCGGTPLTTVQLSFLNDIGKMSELAGDIQLVLFQNSLLEWCQSQPQIYRSLGMGPVHVEKPTIPLAYQISEKAENELHQQIKAVPTDELLMLYVEPTKVDWEKLVPVLKERPTLLLFGSAYSFFHCLQFDTLAKALNSAELPVIVLDRFAPPQLTAQNIPTNWPGKRQMVCFPSAESVESRLQDVSSALSDFLCQISSTSFSESDEAYRLYRLGQAMQFARRAAFLSEAHLPHLLAEWRTILWSCDPYKKHQDILLRELSHYEAQILDQVPAKSEKPKPRSSAPYTIAHIVYQLVDGNHAPSRLTEALITKRNQDLFEPVLISTEEAAYSHRKYPVPLKASPPTQERARKRLQNLAESGCEVFIADPDQPPTATARKIAARLDQLEADVALFHGPSLINQLAIRMSSCPLNVILDHGSLPHHPGADLVIASGFSDHDDLKELEEQLQTEIYSIAFALSFEEPSTKPAITREDLQLPDNAIALTTISNHLESRVGPPMQQAIIQILKNCPNAYYFPMGAIASESEFLRPFEQAGVGARVTPLREQTNAYVTAKAMDIYLNEFPFGSCISLLEAMAAGCPIVTMHDPDGPAQARYGAKFFGLDRAVTSQDPKEYVDLACQLIQDKALREEWSAHARSSYKKFSSTDSFVRETEDLLLQRLSSSSA